MRSEVFRFALRIEGLGVTTLRPVTLRVAEHFFIFVLSVT